MNRKSTILNTNTKHGQKKYHTQTLNKDRKGTIHKHETWTEKVPYTNTKHGQKKQHTQTLNMDRKTTIHKH